MFMFSFGNSFNHEKEQDQTHYHHDEHGGKEHPKQKPKTQECEEQNTKCHDVKTYLGLLGTGSLGKDSSSSSESKL